MTLRLRFSEAWAQNGVATDPDLDTTAPSYIPNRYKDLGWKAEKPPEEWQNFLSQITDRKIQFNLVEGVPVWEGDVTYKSGAITQVAGVFYRAVAATTNQNPTTAGPAVWQAVVPTDKASWDALVADVEDTLAAHLAADNPHKDTIEGIGGVNKTYVNQAVSDALNPKTIPYHIALTGQVHALTPTQAGTLGAATGAGALQTFTGDVTFTPGRMIFNGSVGRIVLADSATAMTTIMSSNNKIGIDSTGAGYVTTAGVSSKIVSEATFIETTNNVNYQFQLPLPMFQINTQYSINDHDGFGWNYVLTKVEPAFEIGKGFVLDGQVLNFNLSYSIPTTKMTYYVTGWDDVAKKLVRGVLDINARPSFIDIIPICKTVLPTITHLISFTMYAPLTAYQKLQLNTVV